MVKYKLRTLKEGIKIKLILNNGYGYIVCRSRRTFPPDKFRGEIEIVSVTFGGHYLDVPMRGIKNFEIIGTYKSPFLKKKRFPSINY